ncbi:DUF6712 family protein [Winogradskyella pulchriflava]|uniref:DUF6712 family protein n=1 Tax=Winogradskyella pulchriflava TaxID=1110688 RepID=A0ABV6QDD2_9FLAO
MKLLFNYNDQGQTELKTTLGFLNADFNYDNLQPDIKLNTPYLIDLISQEVYDKMVNYYQPESGTPTPNEDLDLAIEYSRLYIASMAYLDYAPNNDMSHSNSGRSFRNEENEKIPWQWQIDSDNAAIAERAYKALDRLFALLDQTEWTEWTNSEAYKAANKLFIKDAITFDKSFSINRSAQLFYRLVPFMEDIETEYINPIITDDLADTLRAVEEPDADQKKLLTLIKSAIAYFSLSKALQSFPVQMFPQTLRYAYTEQNKLEEKDKTVMVMEAEGKKYVLKLENEYGRQTETFTTLKTTNGLTEGKKYVNL